MQVVRRDYNTKVQEYDFALGERTGWRIIYTEFSWPEELAKSSDIKPCDAVRASLLLEEKYPDRYSRDTKYFRDTIFLNANNALSKKEDYVHVAIWRFTKLEEVVRSEILRNLSDEAKALLERGLKEYGKSE